MERKYTKGPWLGRDSAGRFLADNPWSAEHEDSEDFMCAPIHSGGKVIALLVQDNDRSPYVDYTEIDANARLIAAAPELLEALQEVVTGMTYLFGEKSDPATIKARAAIAKALGETE